MKDVNHSLLSRAVVLLGVLVSGCASGPSGRDATGSSSGEGVGLADDVARSSFPAVDELHRFVLVIQESPNGHVTDDWQPAEEFELSQFRFQLHAGKTAERIVLAAATRQRDCDEENRQCINECMSTPLPRGFGHIATPDRKKGGKKVYCERRCMQPYLDCKNAQGERIQEFSTVGGAVDWLKRYRQGILVGSIVVIAGAAVVAVVSGGGGLVLVPVLLLA